MNSLREGIVLPICLVASSLALLRSCRLNLDIGLIFRVISGKYVKLQSHFQK